MGGAFMTHKERILMAARGEMVDVLPYVPRFDLWYNANRYRGTLPARYSDKSPGQIARAEGWALHRVVPELLSVQRQEDNLYRAIGLYGLRECGYSIKFPSNVEIRSTRTADSLQVEYHTPKGVITTKEVITEEMRGAGATITWVEQRAIKGLEDYERLAYLFEQVELVPEYERYLSWQEEIGQDGVAVLMGSFAASPMLHIQRDLLDATRFFYEYHDHQSQMRRLAQSLEGLYEQLLKVVCDSPADVVLWGANYDEMITYPPYFQKEILPWLQKASHALEAKGKLLLCHCDGENQGLLDLIGVSGIHVAEAVCPAPMTKVPIEQYYGIWGKKLTIWGGIPQSLLLAQTASEEEFEAYLDHFFKAVAPGTRLIVGIADTTPPDADFDRLRRIGERVLREGRLPLEAGGFRPFMGPAGWQSGERPQEDVPDETFQEVRRAVLAGDHVGIQGEVEKLLSQGVPASDVLHRGMIRAMESVGARFKRGEVFIPEVLLSARAMNHALKVLEPHLAGERVERGGRILIGTVRGDLHDIGKNMVATMLRGVGFEVRDLGINVSSEQFVREVESYQPQILGLSALLTTTMPEMARVIQALEANGLRNLVKVMVGGAPVNQKFARDIGADGYAQDAGEAVSLAKKILQGR
jgi:methylmalonyl-CoA mutase cobalamin-binding domain/chain